MVYTSQELCSLLERHEVAAARLFRALQSAGVGAAELESLNAEWDAETALLSRDERRAVAAFLRELAALDEADSGV
jgi:hypothetical protein